MWVRTSGVAALAVIMGVLPAAAIASRTTGVVTGIGDTSLQLVTRDKEVHVVTINAATTYVKWITHQPWQQVLVLLGGMVTDVQLIMVMAPWH